MEDYNSDVPLEDEQQGQRPAEVLDISGNLKTLKFKKLVALSSVV